MSRSARSGRPFGWLARVGRGFALVQLALLLAFLAVHRYGGQGAADAETGIYFASVVCAWGGIVYALVLAAVGTTGSRSGLIWTGAILAIVGFVGILVTGTVTPKFLLGT
ncbi:MAG: hypothetical protein GC161_09385 [Planctomycetaceae bacterium]|nr:hypothetical protein [Planctomycetaceae bacterium]